MIINVNPQVFLLIIFSLLLFNYLYFLFKILRGLKKLKPFKSKNIPDDFVTVIIPFRNEEKNILQNLKSIERQNYPESKYEVIYVNDSSEDSSLKILNENISSPNVKVISVPYEYSISAHKKRAIRYGIENSAGEIIVTTDADCIYDSDWLKSLLTNFDKQTAFISGPVEFEDEKNIFAQIQKLEFTGLVLAGAGLIGAEMPTICNAANIAYRRKIFNEVGGFKDQMNLSSGDDELLMQKVARDTNYRIRFSVNPKSIVRTHSNKSLKEFYNQRKRWASKGLFYRDELLVFKLILIYLFFIGLALQLVLTVFYNWIFIISLITSIVLKIFIEFQILSEGKKILFKKLSLNYFVMAEIFHIPYIIIAGLVGSFGNYFWKERKLKR